MMMRLLLAATLATGLAVAPTAFAEDAMQARDVEEQEDEDGQSP